MARQRDRGFSWWQWWDMTVLALMGALGAFALLSGLPMFLFVIYANFFSLEPNEHRRKPA
ncbi:hypothetical protein [Xanthomonas campestris]|uniref:hypothetical protein n=1 Tax=Xanthomonas campestris TaxID=339 RepID=UPI003CCF3AE7